MEHMPPIVMREHKKGSMSTTEASKMSGKIMFLIKVFEVLYYNTQPGDLKFWFHFALVHASSQFVSLT